MKLFQDLNNELKEVVPGTYAPYYFRYLGYKKDLAAAPATFRANGITSLFEKTTPVINGGNFLSNTAPIKVPTAEPIKVTGAT